MNVGDELDELKHTIISDLIGEEQLVSGHFITEEHVNGEKIKRDYNFEEKQGWPSKLIIKSIYLVED